MRRKKTKNNKIENGRQNEQNDYNAVYTWVKTGGVTPLPPIFICSPHYPTKCFGYAAQSVSYLLHYATMVKFLKSSTIALRKAAASC